MVDNFSPSLYYIKLSLYYIKLYIGITISIFLALFTCLLFISLMQLVKGAQYLNATPLSLSSACLAAASAPAPVIVIVPVTRM